MSPRPNKVLSHLMSAAAMENPVVNLNMLHTQCTECSYYAVCCEHCQSFNDSMEVRDSVYGDWLARKTSQVSREKSSKIQAKKLEDEKKRQKEVI